MTNRVFEMLCEEIGLVEARIARLQDAVKRHCDDTDFVGEAKVELATLHTRLDELREREKKYV